jgi:hypothetical protein
MGYDSRIWSVLFYVSSGLFLAISASSAPDLGLSLIAYKWTMIVLGTLAGVTGKLGASWLSKTGDTTTSTVTTSTTTPPVTKLAPLILLLLLLPFTSGCAPTMKAKLQQADAGVYSALMAVDKAEQGLFDQQVVCGAAPCVSAVTHQKFSRDFATALRAGKTFHLSVAAWKPGQPVPVDVNQVALALKAATDTVKSAIPAGPQKDQLGLLLDAAAFAVNQALLALLPPAQANVLMPSPVYAVN